MTGRRGRCSQVIQTDVVEVDRERTSQTSRQQRERKRGGMDAHLVELVAEVYRINVVAFQI